MRLSQTLPATLLILIACTSRITGNEGNFEFSYVADDRITDFNKPIAVGAKLDLEVRDVGQRRPVELLAAAYDDPSVLEVLSFDGNSITVQGVGAGTALLEVEGTTANGETLTDSVNMLSAVPEVLNLWHTCDYSLDSAAYLAGQKVWVPFDMERSNGQPVIGYGYYPVDLSSEAGALNVDEGIGSHMVVDTVSAGALVLSSQIDDTTLTMQVIDAAQIDGVQEPIAGVVEDIDVGDTNLFFVRPMFGELIVCQADLTKQVVSDTPDICAVEDRDSKEASEDSTAENSEYETGWFAVEGLAEGACQFTITYPDANGGQGVSAQFSYPIEP